MYDGDYPNGTLGPLGELSVGFFQNSSLSFDLDIGAGELAAQNAFNTIVQYTRLNAMYRVLNFYRTTPYFQAGGGYLLNVGDDPFGEGIETTFENSGFINGAIGFEFMAGQKTGIDFSAGYYWLFNDGIDQVNQGQYNDYYWTLKLGINFYLGK